MRGVALLPEATVATTTTGNAMTRPHVQSPHLQPVYTSTSLHSAPRKVDIIHYRSYPLGSDCQHHCYTYPIPIQATPLWNLHRRNETVVDVPILRSIIEALQYVSPIFSRYIFCCWHLIESLSPQTLWYFTYYYFQLTLTLTLKLVSCSPGTRKGAMHDLRDSIWSSTSAASPAPTIETIISVSTRTADTCVHSYSKRSSDNRPPRISK